MFLNYLHDANTICPAAGINTGVFRTHRTRRTSCLILRGAGFCFLPLFLEAACASWAGAFCSVVSWFCSEPRRSSSAAPSSSSLSIAQRISCTLHREHARAILKWIPASLAKRPSEHFHKIPPFPRGFARVPLPSRPLCFRVLLLLLQLLLFFLFFFVLLPLVACPVSLLVVPCCCGSFSTKFWRCSCVVSVALPLLSSPAIRNRWRHHVPLRLQFFGLTLASREHLKLRAGSGGCNSRVEVETSRPGRKMSGAVASAAARACEAPPVEVGAIDVWMASA